MTTRGVLVLYELGSWITYQLVQVCHQYGMGLHPTLQITAASDKDYQLLAHDQLISLGTLASSTTKTGRHDIAENISCSKCVNMFQTGRTILFAGKQFTIY